MSKRERKIEKEILTFEEVLKEMPKVGDILYKVPTVQAAKELPFQHPPIKCVVTRVVPERLWYEVRFDFANSDGTTRSFKQCYKLPENIHWDEDDIPNEPEDLIGEEDEDGGEY